MLYGLNDAGGGNLETVQSTSLVGWDAGVKLGTGVGRLGWKFYGTAGWSSATFDNDGDTEDASSYYLGGGLGYNWNSVALDFVLNYYDATAATDYVGASVGNIDEALDLGASL